MQRNANTNLFKAEKDGEKSLDWKEIGVCLFPGSYMLYPLKERNHPATDRCMNQDDWGARKFCLHQGKKKAKQDMTKSATLAAL